jgi:hypothetical protein
VSVEPVVSGCGPSFLVVGGQRCGTTFLHRLLKTHPEIWVTPIKELHYFDEQRGAGRLNPRNRKHLRRLRTFIRRAVCCQPGSAAELGWALRYFCGRRTDEWYRGLFSPAGTMVAGEMTPDYGGLSLERAGRVAELFPKIKAVLYLRDPVARAWSGIVKDLGRKHGRNISSIDTATICSAPETAYAMHLSRFHRSICTWEDVLGANRLYIGYFEQLVASPAVEMERLCAFLDVGPHPQPERGTPPEPVNTARAYGGEIPQQVASYLAGELLPDTRLLAARLGGPAHEWLTRMEALAAAPGGAR